MIRVGFLISSIEGSLGSHNYFRNLFSAINSLSDRKIVPVLFKGKRTKYKCLQVLPPVEIIQTGLLDRYSPLWIIHKILHRFLAYSPILEQLLKKHNISLLSHSGYLGRNAKIPAMGWIQDFQHRHLPDFFTHQQLAGRDKKFMEVCRYCNYVLLSSFDAQNDLRLFAPDFKNKAKVLHFVGGSIEKKEFPGLKNIEKHYNFKAPYFYVPNQFWIHKNHRIIIDALKIIKSKNHKVLVMATGNAGDFRHSDYFNSLMVYAQENDVADCFKVLGIVPYPDVMSLMHNSLALINPSLFEGWSTVVEEAKTIGKKIILSDIPVHREQAPAGGVYFKPDDAQTLADSMLKLWNNHNPDDDLEIARQAHESFASRIESFAKAYQDIVLEIIDYPLLKKSNLIRV